MLPRCARGPDGRFLSATPTSASMSQQGTAGAGPSTQPDTTPEASTVPGPAPQAITLTPDQLAQIIGRALQSVTQLQAVPNAEPPAAAITAASFPQFVPPPEAAAVTGTSLLDQFPSVKQSVLLEIARHEFEPSDLYQLDSKYLGGDGHDWQIQLMRWRKV